MIRHIVNRRRDVNRGYFIDRGAYVRLKVFEQAKTNLIPFVYQYLLSVPPDYDQNDNNKKWLLVLFLHAAGESHPPMEKVLKHGPPKLIDAYEKNKQGVNSIDDVNIECANFLAENFVTCSPQVNQGGYGTWSLAMDQPNRFAAIIPICGRVDERKVSSLKHLTIWNFHGKLDDVIPVEESIKLINVLNSQLCKSTIYPDLKHDSWTRTYYNKDIYIWLLQQTKTN